MTSDPNSWDVTSTSSEYICALYGSLLFTKLTSLLVDTQRLNSTALSLLYGIQNPGPRGSLKPSSRPPRPASLTLTPEKYSLPGSSVVGLRLVCAFAPPCTSSTPGRFPVLVAYTLGIVLFIFLVSSQRSLPASAEQEKGCHSHEKQEDTNESSYKTCFCGRGQSTRGRFRSGVWGLGTGAALVCGW
ncbi:hypothetical protein B0T25DRAFT_136565 [Lasiosphaeria hispida]|uniref:Uncharacterized protein n=1 Tax=Lasiosphaeria hispida TaxID=260671 RepID=A0AAJ0MFC0_9PEZI|nr:hypothetical protein B0T25DRAFT_136565 [Lasiosphaeria hispida]